LTSRRRFANLRAVLPPSLAAGAREMFELSETENSRY
jgi:hypothetical protein